MHGLWLAGLIALVAFAFGKPAAKVVAGIAIFALGAVGFILFVFFAYAFALIVAGKI